MHFTTKSITKSAIIAAVYAVLTVILSPISFGPVQLRIAESLTILPMFMPEAIPGLTIGCFIANLLGGGMLADVIIGSIATMLAAICTHRLRRYFIPAAVMPVVFNGLVVGPVVYFCYVMGNGIFSMPILASTVASVAAGEAAVVFTLGLILRNALRSIPTLNR